MSLSAKELKAIHWYCQQYGLRPELSSVPTMYFKDRSGKKLTKDLTAIMLEYGQWRDEEKKLKARESRKKK